MLNVLQIAYDTRKKFAQLSTRTLMAMLTPKHKVLYYMYIYVITEPQNGTIVPKAETSIGIRVQALPGWFRPIVHGDVKKHKMLSNSMTLQPINAPNTPHCR